jgi:mRNA deadenylase 3'-5' endonuclease subunit Ccr4
VIERDLDSARIRVATLNLFGVRADWARRRQVVRNEFADLQPDLVSFQEPS